MSTTYTSTLIYGLNIDDIDNMPEHEAAAWAEQIGLNYHYNGESYIGIDISYASEDNDNAEDLEPFLNKVNSAAKRFQEKMKQKGMLILIINSY